MKTNVLLAAVLLAACGPQLPGAENPGGDSTSPVTEVPPANPPVEVPHVDPPPVDPPPVHTGFPCAVREALQAGCASCHAGAVYVVRFSTRDDFLTSMGDGTTFGQRAVTRLNSAQQPMPPPGVQRPLTAEERQTLLSWVESGMPAGECGPLVDP